MKIDALLRKQLLDNGDSNKALDSSASVAVVQGRLGLSVVAVKDISQGTHIASFDGKIYTASKASALPKSVVNHAIQFSGHLWRDSIGIAKYLNHSCSPNCFLYGLFDLYTLKDIKNGEELTWDYSISEDSDWVVPGGKCLCLSSNCRGVIPPYSVLSDAEKYRIEPMISSWIRNRK